MASKRLIISEIRPFLFSLLAATSLFISLAVFVTLLPKPAEAQEKLSSPVYRYRGHEMSTGYYEQWEVRPRPYMPLAGGPVRHIAGTTLTTTGEWVRRRTYLADSHQRLRFYQRLKCIKCHPQQARGLHTVRVGITCRQCHGPEPIAGINHYYSLMNPIRRHSHVCSKCHEGANASYATYVVHEPNPASMDTRKTFPMLFYVFWMMVAIAVGTFLVFLPHAAIWGIRELFTKRGKAKR
jgi:hypothetical protein